MINRPIIGFPWLEMKYAVLYPAFKSLMSKHAWII